jgi:multisubunit Na+/H+ antiporter MnhG subunit
METQERGPTGWVGWVVFAAVMMIMLGVFSIIGGFIAIIDDSYTAYGNTAKNSWGWTTLILGVIVLLAAFAMMQGRTWGRIVGVILTSLVAIDHFTTVRGYPVWDFLIIVLCVFVIYALIVHGGELREEV